MHRPGLPRDKVPVVRNAPGYATTPGRVAEALDARATREGPLRVLFLGRLDAQKGHGPAGRGDRRDARARTWPGASSGARVLGDGGAAAAGGGGGAAGAGGGGVDALYAWADLLVLPSRFEGVPLVILEAQRMGCAVAATDVGAVAEIVADGADGVLVPAGLPEEAIVARFTLTIQRLAADRAALRAMGAAAASRAAGPGLGDMHARTSSPSWTRWSRAPWRCR